MDSFFQTQGAHYRNILEALPFPVFVVDQDMRMVDLNQAGSKLVADEQALVLRQRSGEAWHCLRATPPVECGQPPSVKTIGLGVNMEFVRHADKSFEWGVAKAAELGYAYVEPMVHWGRELICRKAKRDIVFSVECGTIDQAAKSIAHLKKLLR